MLSAKNFINLDELEQLPALNRKNYLYETKLLHKELTKKAKVLQVGSMDGLRIIRIHEVRPDLQLTGLELEDELVKVAKKITTEKNIMAKFITGDITNPPNLPNFDYVICLNNTLGYIPKQEKAIKEMKKLGKTVIISVYGEKFDNQLAEKYFSRLSLEIKKVKDNTFVMKDFSQVKRYTKKEVTSWGGKILETPVGYFTILT